MIATCPICHSDPDIRVDAVRDRCTCGRVILLYRGSYQEPYATWVRYPSHLFFTPDPAMHYVEYKGKSFLVSMRLESPNEVADGAGELFEDIVRIAKIHAVMSL